MFLFLLACGGDDLGDDLDGDGVPEGQDCAEGDPDVYPGAPELCRDGEVNDCDDTEADARAECALWREVYAETASTILVGAHRGDRAGAAVTGLGDVTGDGVPDLAVGAPGYGSGGAVLVVSGEERGRDDLSIAVGLWEAGSDTSEAGAAVVGAGDVDEDGAGDVLVGAPGGLGDDGQVFLLTGVAGEGDLEDGPASWTGDVGFGTSVAVGDLDGDGATDVVVGSPEESVAYVSFGPHDGASDLYPDDAAFSGDRDAEAGTSVAAGDLDGDGVDDLVVGVPGWDGTGGVAVRYGPIDGPGDVDLRIDGTDDEGEAGHTVASGQDVDGDGRDDLVVGAPAYEDRGAAWVITDPSAGTLPLVAAAELDSVRAGDYSAATVALVGDVDGDGFADLAVGAPEVEDASGTAYVVYGPVLGTFDLIDSDIRIVTAYDGDQLGEAIAGAGDLDGDGRGDLVLGSQERSDPDDQVGVVWLFLAAPI